MHARPRSLNRKLQPMTPELCPGPRWMGQSLASLLLVAACAPAPDSGPGRAADSSPAGGATQPTESTPALANKVWRVATGSDSGAYYVFVSDGTLLIASNHGTPALGRWKQAGDTVTLVEEGIPHPAAILEQSDEALALRLSGRGEPLELRFTRGRP